MIDIWVEHHGRDCLTIETANGASKPSSPLRCRATGKFAQWLARSGGSLLITTYTSGKLVLVTSQGDRLKFRSIAFPRPMGMALQGRQLAIATQRNLLLYKQRSAKPEEADAVVQFRPQCVFHTGRLDTHDLAFGDRGLYLVNTRFNCIARASQRYSFLHRWRPSFIADLVAKDHCHLNGMGMLDDKPAMATAFAETNHERGWRTEDRFTSGVLIDVTQNAVVARGLCMPHSPRFHRDRWWLCNSGLGALCQLDPTTNEVEEVCRLPGFTRGLCFVGGHALVGLSRIRRKHVLDTALFRDKPLKSKAGVSLVDLESGRPSGMFEFVSGGNEVYEVLFLPGVKLPHIPPVRGVIERPVIR